MRLPWRRASRERQRLLNEVMDDLVEAHRAAGRTSDRIDRAIARYRIVTELAAAEQAMEGQTE